MLTLFSAIDPSPDVELEFNIIFFVLKFNPSLMSPVVLPQGHGHITRGRRLGVPPSLV